jgi:hypothetical protein
LEAVKDELSLANLDQVVILEQDFATYTLLGNVCVRRFAQGIHPYLQSGKEADKLASFSVLHSDLIPQGRVLKTHTMVYLLNRYDKRTKFVGRECVGKGCRICRHRRRNEVKGTYLVLFIYNNLSMLTRDRE